MKNIFVMAVLFTILLTPSHVWAWGATGHRVVGEIAQNYLSHKAQKKITKLLKGDSLARVANWPDEIKSDPTNYAYTYNWHYTDWPDESQTYDPDHNSGTLVTAIENNIKVLKDQNSKDEDKVFALKFLAHLIGDIHMPLHVGNGVDRGGNNCKVVFQNQATNLHKLWDEDMINFTKLSFTELAIFINVIKKDEVRKIQQGTALDWARESKGIRNSVYPKDLSADPNQISTQKSYCMTPPPPAPPLPQEKLPKLGYEYSYQFLPILERRLLEGGLRLAMVLNAALD